MKFGQQLEHESVPQWSLHNIDYNSLKHEIKVHTTRDQATAIAIPGHQDTTLVKFEGELYQELCRQHDRVHLFVTSKADEIARRLDHLASNVRRWLSKYPSDSEPEVSIKRQRKYLKYEREVERCGDDINALTRFANAQIVAFRKILKKYKKWTRSDSLGTRFNATLSGDPKSFTHRDFSHLQSRCQDLRSSLKAASPVFSEPSSPEETSPAHAPERRASRVSYDLLPPARMEQPVKYWNEYDHGSDAGSPEDDYAIYINPDNDDSSFPGLGHIRMIFSLPFEKIKAWFNIRDSSERRPLLSSSDGAHDLSNSNQTDPEDDFSSVEGLPVHGYSTIYAFPSIGDQKAARYRERVLGIGSLASFVVSYILIIITGILISTGKHKLRVEVDAGVAVGVALSLICACSGMGMMLYRRDEVTLSYGVLAWVGFVASCLLNGMLLVLVVSNMP